MSRVENDVKRGPWAEDSAHSKILVWRPLHAIQIQFVYMSDISENINDKIMRESWTENEDKKVHTIKCTTQVGGVAQRKGRRSLTGGLSLICA